MPGDTWGACKRRAARSGRPQLVPVGPKFVQVLVELHLLFDSGLQVCAGLGKLILGPHLRVFGLVAVLALLRSWRAGRHGRSSNGNRQDCRERIPHVHSPCCSDVTDKKEISRQYGGSNNANLPHATCFPRASSCASRIMIGNYAPD